MRVLHRRTRTWLITVGIILLAAAAARLYVLLADRTANVEFHRIAGISYQEAMGELETTAAGRAYAIPDGKRVRMVATGIRPGEDVGMSPRFENIGTTPATLYAVDKNEWYVFGSMKVLDYFEGGWRQIAILRNQRFVQLERANSTGGKENQP